VPAFLASVIVSMLLFGAVAGTLWLFVFGDEPWPSIADGMMVSILVVAFLTILAAFLSAAYLAGKKQEARATMNTNHVVWSAGATALLVLLVVSHQWSVGNFGPKSDELLCSDYCKGKGFVASGMPPRNTGDATCSCFDAAGREAEKVPLRMTDSDVASPHKR
jgi:hypothetical protein